jgi:hypothetical protein
MHCLHLDLPDFHATYSIHGGHAYVPTSSWCRHASWRYSTEAAAAAAAATDSSTHRLQLLNLALPCLQLIAAGGHELRQLFLIGHKLLCSIAGSGLLLLQLHLQVINGVLWGTR